ncbi:MAG: hypothetical protein ABIE23_02210 [archaeon]|nr:PIN domain-containing protein [Candidatus Micrarchaeota archaeon]
MPERIYIDTNIYLDYFEERKDIFRPLGEFAFQVFKRTLECEFEIVISDWVIEELSKQKFPKVKFDLLLRELSNKGKIVKVRKTEQDLLNARKYENFSDAIHGFIAHRTNCKKIVTRNIEDFLDIRHFIEPILPENL